MIHFTKEMVDSYADKLLIGLTEEENKMVLDEFAEIDRNINIINAIPNIKDITYNTNQNEDEKKLDLDDDFSWVFDEDCAVTTSSIGPAVQYTADKELDEDTLIETILQAESPYRNSEGKYDNDYVYGSFDRKNGVIHTRDKKFITKKDIISYYMKELQYLNDGHKNGTLTPSQVFPCSDRVVWWVCTVPSRISPYHDDIMEILKTDQEEEKTQEIQGCGKEWEESIVNRVTKFKSNHTLGID